MATNQTTRTTGRTDSQPTTDATTTTATYTVTLPAIGTIVGGKDDEPMIVVNHPRETASEYTFNEQGTEKTLTEAHGCPPEAPVVEAVYINRLDQLVDGWREAYAAKPPEKFVEWLGGYRAEWGITEKVLKRYGYSLPALHDISETEEIEMEYARTIAED